MFAVWRRKEVGPEKTYIQELFSRHGYHFQLSHLYEEPFLPTCGTWFYLDVAGAGLGANSNVFSPGAFSDAAECFHGTSLDAVFKLLRGTHADSLRAGPNKTKRRSQDETEQAGVYNESGTRTKCVLNYTVHDLFDTTSGFVVGAVLELLRDNKHTVRVGLQHLSLIHI